MNTEELVNIIVSQFEISNKKNSLEGDELESGESVNVSALSFDYLKDTPYEVKALTDVTFSVKTGIGHGLIGKTGSGKSTVLQHLNGLLRPQFGEVRVGEFLLNNENIDMKQIVQYAGLVMQNPENQFFEHFVGDEVAFGPKNIEYEGKLSDRVEWAMEIVGLNFEKFKDRQIKNLSGGEKRKVALASILSLKPQLLLLDEPTAGLDPKSRSDVIKAFKDLLETGMTIIISTHNLMDIMELTESLTLLESGRSVVNGLSGLLVTDMDMMLNHGIDPPFISKIISGIRHKTGIQLWGIRNVVELTEQFVMRENDFF